MTDPTVVLPRAAADTSHRADAASVRKLIARLAARTTAEIMATGQSDGARMAPAAVLARDIPAIMAGHNSVCPYLTPEAHAYAVRTLGVTDADIEACIAGMGW